MTQVSALRILQQLPEMAKMTTEGGLLSGPSKLFWLNRQERASEQNTVLDS